MGREGEHSQNVGWTRLPTLFQAPYFGNAMLPTLGFYPTQRYPSMRCGMSQTTLTKQLIIWSIDIGIKHLSLFHLFPSSGTQETDKEESALFSAHWDGCHVEFLPLGNTIQKQQGESPPFTTLVSFTFPNLWKYVVALFACLVFLFSSWFDAEIMSRVKKKPHGVDIPKIRGLRCKMSSQVWLHTTHGLCWL